MTTIQAEAPHVVSRAEWLTARAGVRPQALSHSTLQLTRTRHCFG